MSETPEQYRASQDDELGDIDERIALLKQFLQRGDAALEELRAGLIQQEAAHAEMRAGLAQLEAMRDALLKQKED